jgi:NitT/TauT family transport system substrate-binding protein
MKRIVIFLTAAVLLTACGMSHEERQRQHREQQRQLAREDSAALKVAVVPTLDCLPVMVAKELQLFDTLGIDVRPKLFKAQMDCDTALVGGSVEGAVTDLVRAERMKQKGTSLRYVAATGAYWQLLSGHHARIRQLKQLDDKMVAMTRYSATDLLTDVAVDSAKLKTERVFRIQVNDVGLRLRMMLNGAMDALFLPEPQATQARLAKSVVLMDSRNMDYRLGVIAFREKALKNKDRQRQLELFLKAYDQACDTITRYGMGYFAELIERYCDVDRRVVDSLPENFEFPHAAPPREKDIERLRK